MSKITYNENDINTLVALLNSLTISGLQNIKAVSMMANILDRGVVSKEGGKDETD